MRGLNKIFNIGFNKAGTSSLTRAMEILGFKSIHYLYRGKIISKIIRENEKKNKKLLNGMENYIFFSDCFWSEDYKKLDQQYPNSKFILTIREINSWVKSRERHLEKEPNLKEMQEKYPTCPWWNINKKEWVKFRLKYISELKEYFKDRPEDFLIIDIPKGEGWEKLCSFLNLPIPDKPFPLLNVKK